MADNKLQSITQLEAGKPFPEGTYSVTRGTFQIIDQKNSPKDYDAVAKGRNAKNRSTYLKQLTPEEQNVVKQANVEGKGVLWNMGGGKSYLFVPSEKEIEEARKREQVGTAQAAQQQEEDGTLLKWGLRLLAIAGFTFLGYIIGKKNGKSKTSQHSVKNDTKTQTSASNTENTSTNTSVNSQQPSLTVDTPVVSLAPTPTSNALGGNSGGGLLNTMKTASLGTVDTSPTPSINALRGPQGHSW
ncbi:MAG: hypothetical protein IJY58_00730 [Alphaproteobacteria bacterium]|nr:hypothetical protein [Alphaproteobacteria bacterium]